MASTPVRASTVEFDTHEHTIGAIAFAPDSARIASMDERNVVRLWRVDGPGDVRHQGSSATDPTCHGIGVWVYVGPRP